MTATTQTTGFQGYHPEMNEKRPDCQIEANLSHYGKHWFLYTPLTLSGRGVEFLGSCDSDYGQRRTNWNRYKVTQKAFDKICSQHSVSSEMLL